MGYAIDGLEIVRLSDSNEDARLGRLDSDRGTIGPGRLVGEYVWMADRFCSTQPAYLTRRLVKDFTKQRLVGRLVGSKGNTNE